MIGKPQYKDFENQVLYDNWHKKNYHALNGLKESGLWINDGKVTVEYIKLF